MDNQLLLVGDDLREAALAVGGIETYLLKVRDLLETAPVTRDRLDDVRDDDLVDRVSALEDALGSLQRSVARLHQAFTGNTR